MQRKRSAAVRTRADRRARRGRRPAVARAQTATAARGRKKLTAVEHGVDDARRGQRAERQLVRWRRRDGQGGRQVKSVRDDDDTR